MAGKQGRKKGSSTSAQLRPSGSTVSGPKKPAAAPVPACKYYLSKATVQSILNHKREPIVIGSYFNKMDDENKKLVLEMVEEHEKIEDRYAVYQDKVRKEFEANGFVALPDDYDERRAAVNAASCETFRRLAAESSPDGFK